MSSGKMKNNNESAKCGVEQARRDHKALTIVFVSLVVDLLAFTMILPLLPALLDYYGHRDQGGLYGMLKSSVTGFRELVGAPDTPRWNSVLFGGLIGSLFSFLQFLSSPLMGAASDVYGRRPVMIISMVGIAASYALWMVSHNFTIFVLARIVGGISKGNVSLSTAIVADVAPPEKRGKGMALIGIAFSIGFLFGPLIGAFFSKQARKNEEMFFAAPAMFALMLALLDVLFLFAFFKETLPVEKRAKDAGNSFQTAISKYINPLSLFRFEAVQGSSAKDIKAMQGVGVGYFLYLFFYSGLEFTLTFLTHTKFEYDSLQQGKMFFVIGIVMVTVQGGFVRRIKPGKELVYGTMAIALVIPSFVIVGFAYEQAMLYSGLILYAISSATVVPCLTTVVSSYGTAEQKGTVMGIFRSLGALARALGPMYACTLYWTFGPAVCYTIGAVCLLLPVILLTRLKKSLKVDKEL